MLAFMLIMKSRPDLSPMPKDVSKIIMKFVIRGNYHDELKRQEIRQISLKTVVQSMYGFTSGMPKHKIKRR